MAPPTIPSGRANAATWTAAGWWVLLNKWEEVNNMTTEMDVPTVEVTIPFDPAFVEWAVACMAHTAEHVEQEHGDSSEFRDGLMRVLQDAQIAGASLAQAAVLTAIYLVDDDISDKVAHDLSLLAYALHDA